jgi:threonylcarbamoyladenosine tRNA methylthiotransferase MtaB
MKVSVQTIGCKVNQSESSFIEGTLGEKGHVVVKASDDPDICIINTCTVTQKSDYQSRQLIRKAIRSGAKVIATGCYAQVSPDELKKIEGLGLIVGNSGKSDIVDLLDRLNEDREGPEFINKEHAGDQLASSSYCSGRSRAFLKIQDGCNASCTYCKVPMARGRSRSLGRQDVIDTAGRLVKDGYKEIVVTGIHIGSYGLDLTPVCSLFEIVKELSMTYPQTRIRLSSIEPQEFDMSFLELINNSSLCPHLHIPLQSGSDEILKRMNRGYSASFYKDLLQNIISKHPDISIGTDVIVGFPGEKDSDFKATYDLLNESPLSYLHIFTYSKREETPASVYPEQVSDDIKKERSRALFELGSVKKKDYITRYLGKIVNVVVEMKPLTDGYYRAITDNYIRAKVKGERVIAGQRIDMLAKAIHDDTLTGVIE